MMYLALMALLLAGLAWLGWRLWHSPYRRAAMAGLAAGAVVVLLLPFFYGFLFGFTFLHGSARPGFEAGFYCAVLAVWFLAPMVLPLAMLGGVAWQRLRHRRVDGPRIPWRHLSRTSP
ncbi:hypothetical protein H5407_21345 [Mitsuaria sp. WAJ17]|uniref:hypothetical protein n=1 Tax=Mitsuaria sp. WAJ17 TaxID=2761452 RepID=UPI0015FFEB1E|nr:hypothetical protein [Mitsuaria sp. WAJ17]MBB2487790.1 hypothetical protein [Mitsuaria sp. WAJ17]